MHVEINASFFLISLTRDIRSNMMMLNADRRTNPTYVEMKFNFPIFDTRDFPSYATKTKNWNDTSIETMIDAWIIISWQSNTGKENAFSIYVTMYEYRPIGQGFAFIEAR